MKKLIGVAVLVVALAAVAAPAAGAGAAGATQIPGAIWAEGTLFGTVLTPTELPDKGKFTPIYNFMDSGLEGQHSISAAGPGDPGYYGGRWMVYLATYTPEGLEQFDNGSGQVKYELTSLQELEDAVDAGYVVVTLTDTRFVCPLNAGR